MVSLLLKLELNNQNNCIITIGHTVHILSLYMNNLGSSMQRLCPCAYERRHYYIWRKINVLKNRNDRLSYVIFCEIIHSCLTCNSVTSDSLKAFLGSTHAKHSLCDHLLFSPLFTKLNGLERAMENSELVPASPPRTLPLLQMASPSPALCGI